jgi:hypothetical protein
VALRLTQAKIARFLIWIGKSAIPNPKALAGVIELIDSADLGRCALGSGALKRLHRRRTMRRASTVALMTWSTIVVASSAPAAPAKRVSPTIPIATQTAKCLSPRVVALARGFREPKNRKVKRSKGGTIAPPRAKTMS